MAVIVRSALKCSAFAADEGSVNTGRSLPRPLTISTTAVVSVLGAIMGLWPGTTSAEVPASPGRPALVTAIVEPIPADATPADAAETVVFADAAPQEPVTASEPPAPLPPPEPNPCADALSWVTEAGLRLPAGVDYLCPSTMFAHQGTACWQNAIYCPGGGLVAINTGLLQGTSTDYLRHVVAHEVCHILEFQAAGRTTEASADACAAAHGAP